MQNSPTRNAGFTIVELLIVIVVIAVIAAISVVAYNGIQNRTSDSAVQADLANFGKQLKLIEVDTGAPAPGGRTRSAGTDGAGSNVVFPNVTFKPVKNAYLSNVSNFYYCTGTESATSQITFRLVARSKSGTAYEYHSNGSLVNLGNTSISSTSCLTPYNNTGTWSYGYDAPSLTWSGWTN